MGKSHQVFVGCPFTQHIRSNYDRLKADLESETPLAIVLADTVGVSSTDYLLGSITELIRDSACLVRTTRRPRGTGTTSRTFSRVPGSSSKTSTGGWKNEAPRL